MSNSENNQSLFEDLDLSNVSTSWVYRLNKQNLINELSRRNLKTTGIVTELRDRLLKYLRAESSQDDFEIPVEKTPFLPNPAIRVDQSLEKNNMADTKKPYFKPGKFSGNISENIDQFLKRFERAAIINGWTNSEKSQYIAVYLEGAALTFYENIHYSVDFIEWEELEVRLRQEFEPIAQSDMLRIMLEKRKQLPDEQTISYINEAESLCRRINKNMPQGELVHNIMKGLKPSIARYIGIMENKTLDELKNNIRKYDLIEFMVTGESEKSPFDIENSIFQNKIQQINNNENCTDLKYNRLQDEINNLREQFKNVKFNNNNHKLGNVNQYNKCSNYNDESNNYNNLRAEIDDLKKQLKEAQTNNNGNDYNFNNNNRYGKYNNKYDKLPNNNRQINHYDNYNKPIGPNQTQNVASHWYGRPFPYNTSAFTMNNNNNSGNRGGNSTNNSGTLRNGNNDNIIVQQNNNRNNYQTHDTSYNNISQNNLRKQCTFCLRTNHTEEQCFIKNRNSITCQLCNESGHSATHCNLLTNNQKN